MIEVLIVVAIFAIAVACLARNSNSYEKKLLAKRNKHRAKYGLPKLKK